MMLPSSDVLRWVLSPKNTTPPHKVGSFVLQGYTLYPVAHNSTVAPLAIWRLLRATCVCAYNT